MRKNIYITALLVGSLLCFEHKALPQPHTPKSNSTTFQVKRVVDGDTFVLSDGMRVRLIGVDTPELHLSNKLLRDAKRSRKDMRTIQDLGRRSLEFTKKLISGKNLKLEYDIERHDRYGRLLAYAYLEDGTFVNGKIVEEGYGQVMTVPPNVKYADHLLKLQKEAREKNRGLWEGGLE